MTEKKKNDADRVPVKLLADYWGLGGVRHFKGCVIEVPIDTAKILFTEEKAERADPLPGEDS